MWFRSWFDRPTRYPTPSSARHAQRPADRRLAARRLLLEGLEDRRLLAFDVLGEFATEANARNVLLTEIDAGGQPDLVIANGASAISIRPGNADGTFGSPLAAATGIGSHSVAAGDLTGDGIADLVTANNNDLSLLVGNGDGSFQPPVSITLPAQLSPQNGATLPQRPRSLAIGDLNADGNLDLVVGGQTSFDVYHRYLSCGYYSCGYTGWTTTYIDGYVNVLIGNGSGGFSGPEVDYLGAQRSPTAVAIGEVNGDDNADVLVANVYDFSALLGDGAGAVGNPVHSYSGYTGGSSRSFGDLDGDGKLDAISRSGYSLTVHKGQGDGTFVPSTTMNLGYPIDSAVVGDVNADGKLDLVAVGSRFTCTDGYWYCYDGYHDKLATVALGTGDGDFALPTTSALGRVDFSYDQYYSSLFNEVALADLTGDGLAELVALDSGTSTALVAKGSWPPADAPFISVESPTVLEKDAGTMEVSFTVSLSKAYTQTVTADFHTADFSASAGSDYDAISGSLTFGPGDTSHTITMLVHGDRLSEADETFSILLSNVVNANVGSVGTVTILDNEPRISIDHPYGVDPLTVIEGDGGTTAAVFTVSLAMPYDQEVTVDYYTLTGHTSDIISVADTVRFAPGETSKPIAIQVVNDLSYESLEAFNVYLTNPSPNATIVNGAGYCYIVDNDPSPTLSINDVSRNEGHRNTTLKFTITLSAPATNWIYVNYATADGTATTADGDYFATSGTVAIAPGSTSTTLTVTVRGDKRQEANETFVVNLSSPSGAAIADGQGVGTILNDDDAPRSKSGGNTSLSTALLTDFETTAASRKRRK
jgi:hypothetical protein